jgi:hypothetical protein
MMLPVIYSMSVSLDGFIAGPTGDIGWTAPDAEQFRFHIEQTRHVATRRHRGVPGRSAGPSQHQRLRGAGERLIQEPATGLARSTACRVNRQRGRSLASSAPSR